MDPFLGQIIMFAGNFAPRAWAYCEGQLLAISSNTALFSILGTTYGGDGRTTFALPDFRGRSPIQQGTGPGLGTLLLGERTGNESTTLQIQNLPPAQIQIPCNSDSPDSDDPAGACPSTSSEDLYAGTSDGSMLTGKIIGGGSAPFSNLPPRLGINYIICLQGTFPSRS